MSQFEQVTRFLDRVDKEYGIPGCDCAIAIDGQVVYRHSAGFSDFFGEKPVSPRDTYWIYSATKLFTITAAMQLWDRGLLDLEDPVSKYLPEYAHLRVKTPDGGSRPMEHTLRIRHLMTMTSGLDYDLSRPALQEMFHRPWQEQTTRNFVAAMAADPWNFEPGEHYLYCLGHDVLGAVIEVITGKALSVYMEENIIRPLGMTDTTFHPTPDQLSRASAQYLHLDLEGNRKLFHQHNQYRFSDLYDSGGAGLMSTVDDYIRLPAALSMGGTSRDGYRVLSPEAIQTMATSYLDPTPLADFRVRPSFAGYGYGLGVRVAMNSSLTHSPVGEFGWDGAAGAFVMVDPVNHAALYYAQQVCQSGLTYHHLHPSLRAIACQCWQRQAT